MRIRLYSSKNPSLEPVYVTRDEVTRPTLPVLTKIFNAIAKTDLNVHTFFIALTLWLICACDAVQIFSLGFILSPLSVAVSEQPVPSPAMLFPTSVGNQFALDGAQQSTLSAVVYLGMLIGGLFSPIFDKYFGSRNVLLMCCLTCFMAHIGSAESTAYLMLTVWQGIVGLSLGVRVPIVYSNAAALFPFTQLGFIIPAISFIWVVGAMYASFIGWLTIGYSTMHASWRLYMLFLSLPSLISLILCFFFSYEPMLTSFFYQHSSKSTLQLFKAHYYGKPLKHILFGWCLTSSKNNHHQQKNTTSLLFDTSSDGSGSPQQQYDPNNNINYSNGVYESGLLQHYDYEPELLLGPSSSNINSIIMVHQHDNINTNHNNQYKRTRKPSMYKEDLLINPNAALHKQTEGYNNFETPDPSYGGTSFNDEYLPPNFSQQYHVEGLIPLENNNNNNNQRINNNTIQQQQQQMQYNIVNNNNNTNMNNPKKLLPANDLSFKPQSLPNCGDNNISGLGNNNNNNTVGNAIPSGRQNQNQNQNDNKNNNNNNKTLSRNTITSTPERNNNPSKFIQSPITKTPLRGYDSDWNIDLDNVANVEELFDFLNKKWSAYTAFLSKFYSQYNLHYIDVLEGKDIKHRNLLKRLQISQQQHQQQQAIQNNNNSNNNDNNNNIITAGLTHGDNYIDGLQNSTGSFLFDSGIDFINNHENDDDIRNIGLLPLRNSESLEHNNSNTQYIAIAGEDVISNGIENSNDDDDGDIEENKNKKEDNNFEFILFRKKSTVFFLIILLSIIWFAISFGSAGFSSFLPKMWDRLLPEDAQKDDSDSKYIVSLIYSAIQLPANLFTMFLVTRISPLKLLVGSTIVQFFTMLGLSFFYSYQISIVVIAILIFQTTNSICWGVINYIAVSTFYPEYQVLAFSIQASIGKLGSILSQYAFGYLIEKSTFWLLMTTTFILFASVISQWIFMRYVSPTPENRKKAALQNKMQQQQQQQQQQGKK